MGILNLVSYDLERIDKSSTGLKKQSQYNEPSFHTLIRPQK